MFEVSVGLSHMIMLLIEAVEPFRMSIWNWWSRSLPTTMCGSMVFGFSMMNNFTVSVKRLSQCCAMRVSLPRNALWVDIFLPFANAIMAESSTIFPDRN